VDGRHDDVHGIVGIPDSCKATASMLSEPVTTTAGAGAVTFNAASTRGSWLSASILAGMTTDTPMVIAVMATAAMPKATRGLEGW
jgi:hypothetical protein